ncbi:MAG: thiamine-phosphate synthase [Bacteroidia bacterium]|nr:MAG: thiamine-phosphate synthase [Bacteroidia bacterium]
MTLPKLQYISHGQTYEEQEYSILSALDAGIQWIQLRWKKANESDILKLAEKIKLRTDAYNAILIINDYPHIAKKINATGVHLGLKDIPVLEARNILHNHQWIGGTANTYDDVLQRIKENVTYIGLGPLKFTTTKENLSPILGIEGYKRIIQKLNKIQIPIYAIGGITLDDIEALIAAGVYGIAISSAFNTAKDKSNFVKQINQKLYATT